MGFPIPDLAVAAPEIAGLGSGPTVASSRLLNPVIPEPTPVALLGIGGFWLARRRRA